MIQAEGTVTVDISDSWLDSINPLTNLAGAMIALCFVVAVGALIWWIVRAIASGGLDRAAKFRAVGGVLGVIALAGASVGLIGLTARNVPSMDVAIPDTPTYDTGDYKAPQLKAEGKMADPTVAAANADALCGAVDAGAGGGADSVNANDCDTAKDKAEDAKASADPTTAPASGAATTPPVVEKPAICIASEAGTIDAPSKKECEAAKAKASKEAGVTP